MLDLIKSEGHELVSEHVSGKDVEEIRAIIQKEFGQAPKEELARRAWARKNMIDGIEGDVQAAIFEVSVPSLGTGVELAHAYLRPRMGLSKIPILALYKKDYWPNKLSSMVMGITKEEIPQYTLREYSTTEEAKSHVKEFLQEAEK